MKYRDFIDIIEAEGFVELTKKQRGDHHKYQGYVDDVRKMVTAAYKQGGEDITKTNLGYMIKQSGLPKKVFR